MRFSSLCGVAVLASFCGCTFVEVPLRPLPAEDYAADREIFLTKVAEVAGTVAVQCGLCRPTLHHSSDGVTCVRDAWSARSAFSVVLESRNGYCPNFTAYGSDSSGRVYVMYSCPDRDHV